MVENVTAGLASLSRHFIATNKSAEELQTRLTSIGKMALLGGGALAAGGFGLKLLHGPLEEANKYQVEMAKLQAQGVGDVALAQADKYAKAQKIMGASATDTLKMLAESQSVLRDFEHAKDVTPLLLRMKFGIESVMAQGGHGSGHGEKAQRMFMDALKVAELRGALNDPITGKFSEERFHKTLDLMTKAYTASGGLVKPSEYLNMIKTGGVSAKGLSDNSFFFGMMHMMQEMGGNRVGTSLMSGYQNWVMGRTTQQVAEEMAKSGMIDPSQVKYGKTGHITKVLPGALQNAQMFRENPFEYLEKVVLPQARAKGVQDGQQMTDYLDKLYSNRTWGNLLNTMYRERANIHKHMAAGGQAAGIDELAKIGAGGLPGKEIDYEAKLANLKLVLGEKILPLAVYGLEKLISALDHLTAFAREWPTLTKVLVVGFAALSGLAVVAGGVLLFASAFRALAVIWQFTRLGVVFRGLMSGVGFGLRIAGQAVLFLGRALLMNPIGLIVTGIAVAAFLLWKNWDSIKPKLLELWESIKTGFHTFIHMYLSGWQSLFNFLIDGINKLLPKAMELNRLSFADDYAKANLPQKGGSPYVVPNKGQTVQVNTVLNMDGRQVATAVTTHQAREANRPGMGAPTFDPTRAPMPVGLGYAR
nr:putative phage-related membrane protein [blood disease bacterium R229]